MRVSRWLRRLGARRADKFGSAELPIIDDPAVSVDQHYRWSRLQRRRHVAAAAIVYAFLFMLPAVPLLGVSWLAGIFAGITLVTVLLVAGVALATLVSVVAGVAIMQTPDIPPWDRIDLRKLSTQGNRLAEAAVRAASDARAATARGNGLAEAEVELATSADVWRVAALCRDAERTDGKLKTELYRAAEDTVAAMQRFARLAIAAADQYTAGGVEDLSGQIRLDVARHSPPETKILGELLDSDWDRTTDE
jgi:hypothetical protein